VAGYARLFCSVLSLSERSMVIGKRAMLWAAALTLWVAACSPSMPAPSILSYLEEGQPAVWPVDAVSLSLGDGNAHWSPDGTRYVEGSFYELALHDVLAGETLPVVTGESGHEIIPESVAWAPDGQHFAFLQFDATVYRAQVVALEGLAIRAVELPSGRAGGQVAWLDPTRLVYSDLDRLFVFDLDSGESRELGEGRQPVPSPDGTRVAFERVSAVARSGCASAVGVGVVGADGSAWRVMLDEADRFASLIGWSESGEALLVLSRPIDCNAAQPPPPDRLLRVEVDSGSVATLSTQADGPWALNLLASDPMSDRVAFVEPGCDPIGQSATTQRLVVSSTGEPEEHEVVAETQAAGCAFSMLRWLPTPIERLEVDYLTAR
jgi:hypothetical protein